MRPDVPPNFADALNRAGGNERVHKGLEFAPVDKLFGQTGGGQRFKHLGTHRGKPRVVTLPEWRAGRERQELGNVVGQLIKHRHSFFPAIHADMHMKPEDHEPLSGPLHPIDQFLVAFFIGCQLFRPG